MKYKYTITYLMGKMEDSVNPPLFLKAVFPAFNGETVELDSNACNVYFATKQEPVSISPLVIVTETVLDDAK